MDELKKISLGNWITIISVIASFIWQQATLNSNLEKIDKAVEEQTKEIKNVSIEMTNTNLRVSENTLRIEYLQGEIREKKKE